MRRASFARASAQHLLFVGLVPLIVVGVWASLQLADVQREAVGYRNSLMAETARAEVESFLSGPVATMQQVAHLHSDPNGRQLIASILTDHLDYIESVVFVDASGRVVSANLRPGVSARAGDFVGLDRSRDPLFISARETGAPVWSGVFTSMVTGSRVLGLAVPAESGVVIATIEIDSLGSTVQADRIDPDAQIVIVDQVGNVLFHSDERIARLRPNWAEVPPVAAAREGEETRLTYDREGAEMLGSTAIVDGADWVVLVEQPWADARAPVNGVFLGIALITAMVAGVAVAVAWLSSRSLSRPVMQLAATAECVAGGDYDVSVPHFRHRELEQLSVSISDMAAAVRERECSLARSNEELEATNAQLAAAVEDQERAVSKLGALSAELALTEERERRRLAEELHDGVSQSLAVVQMRLAMSNASGENDPENTAKIQELLAEAIRETRALTSELASPVLYEIGLGAALSELAERVEHTHGLEVKVDVSTTEEGLSDEVKMVLLRAARELLMNVVKHAGTDRAWLELTGDRNVVALTVRDEGAGFDPKSAPAEAEGGFGLFSIRERLPFVGGSFAVESAPGRGTEARITISRSRTE